MTDTTTTSITTTSTTSSSTTSTSSSTSTSITTSSTSSSTTTTTSTTSSSTTTTTSTTSSSTTSTTTSSTTTTTTTTTTQSCIQTITSSTVNNTCRDLNWNQTGVVFASGFNKPLALYIDANDSVYVCDKDGHNIEEWDQCSSNGVVVAGSNTSASGSTSVLLNHPEDVTFDKNGYMYVADTDNDRVQRFPSGSNNGTTVAGTGTAANTLVGLNKPQAVAVDSNSNIYIADKGNKRIMKWTPNAVSGTIWLSDNDLDHTIDIVISPTSTDKIYTTRDDKDVIYSWTSGAASSPATFNQVNDTTKNTLNKPRGMTYDLYGNLYVADRDNDRIVMFCANSTVGIVVAADTGTSPRLDKPVAVALDSNLNLYAVTEAGKNVIKFGRL
ncbi:unnamed protein product [Rotaria sordida]|uniref:SMP-30/Gluconolactonase/LRE-like region domain-containing protein n=1 Tax=Rotaria sordida TaxID=392033 RepID=A0A819G4U5_9BILA|nr:unnamed protein product [Rotaria sordida]